jgi:hypothetical protein
MKPLRIIKVGRKSVKVYHDNFMYFQPNDHVCGDCSIRAVSGALGITWHTALDKLVEKAHLLSEAPTSTECVGALLEENGFKWHPVDVSNGGKRPRVSDFSKGKKGTYVLRVSSHLVCSVNGHYKDIWDCGEKCMYGYWEKK